MGVFDYLPEKAGVYRIRNVNNGKEYIGQSENIRKRAFNHLLMLNNKNHHCQYLQNAWGKYGNNAFVFEVVELINDVTKRVLKERYYINKSKHCYNVIGNANKEYPLSWQDEEAYHDKYTEYIPPEEKYKRPQWHTWVYGGAENPINSLRTRMKENNKPVTESNRK